MNSKTACIFLAVLVAICIAPACSIAQSQTSADIASPAAIPMLAPNTPASPVPAPADESMGMATAPNGIYLELGGSGFLYSLNYDRTLMNIIAVRVGFGYVPLPSQTSTNANGVTSTVTASLTSVPVSVSWFPLSSPSSSPSSKLEIGAGGSYEELVAKKIGKSKVGSGIAYTGILGYRYQPADGGFLFRIAFTPFLSSPIFAGFEPWGGISFGYGF